MATKAEIAEHENVLRRDVQALDRRLETRIREAKLKLETRIAETHARIAETRADLTRWVIGAGLLQATVFVGVLLKVARVI